MSLWRRCMAGWRQRPAGERYRLLAGGLAILAMSGLLIARQLPWQPSLSLDGTTGRIDQAAWESTASRLNLHDVRVETSGADLVLSGTLETPEAFTAFADWAQDQGWWALDWSLARGDEALDVEARFIHVSPLTVGPQPLRKAARSWGSTPSTRSGRPRSRRAARTTSRSASNSASSSRVRPLSSASWAMPWW